MFNEKCGIADLFIALNLPYLYRRNVSESMSQVLQVATMYYTVSKSLIFLGWFQNLFFSTTSTIVDNIV